MADTKILYSLGAVAIVCWVLGEVIGPLNPPIAGKIKLMGNLLAVSMVVDIVWNIYSKVKTFGG